MRKNEKAVVVELTKAEIAAVAGGTKQTEASTGIKG